MPGAAQPHRHKEGRVLMVKAMADALRPEAFFPEQERDTSANTSVCLIHHTETKS